MIDLAYSQCGGRSSDGIEYVCQEARSFCRLTLSGVSDDISTSASFARAFSGWYRKSLLGCREADVLMSSDTGVCTHNSLMSEMPMHSLALTS